MADQTTKKLLDREELRHAIQEEYEEVALNPEKGFHFHTGRRLAGMLGYDETWLQRSPNRRARNCIFNRTHQMFSGTLSLVSNPIKDYQFSYYKTRGGVKCLQT